jgi:hypothetical protein
MKEKHSADVKSKPCQIDADDSVELALTRVLRQFVVSNNIRLYISYLINCLLRSAAIKNLVFLLSFKS